MDFEIMSASWNYFILIHCFKKKQLLTFKGFPDSSYSKESACNLGDGFDPWVGKIPWRREWQPTPVFLPGELHEQRSLAGYSPWGRKESDTTEPLTRTLMALWVKNAPMMQETQVTEPWVGKIPWKRKWQPTLVLLPGKSHGQRSLAGYSPWGCKELDMTERLSTHWHLKIKRYLRKTQVPEFSWEQSKTEIWWN